VYQPILSFDAGLLAPQWKGFFLHFLSNVPEDVGIYCKTKHSSIWPLGELLYLGSADRPRPDAVQASLQGDEDIALVPAFMELAAGTVSPQHRPPAVQFGELPNMRWLDTSEDDSEDDETEQSIVHVGHARPDCLHCQRPMPYVGCVSTDSCCLPLGDWYIYLYFCSRCEVQCVYNEYC